MLYYSNFISFLIFFFLEKAGYSLGVEKTIYFAGLGLSGGPSPFNVTLAMRKLWESYENAMRKLRACYDNACYCYCYNVVIVFCYCYYYYACYCYCWHGAEFPLRVASPHHPVLGGGGHGPMGVPIPRARPFRACRAGPGRLFVPLDSPLGPVIPWWSHAVAEGVRRAPRPDGICLKGRDPGGPWCGLLGPAGPSLERMGLSGPALSSSFPWRGGAGHRGEHLARPVQTLSLFHILLLLEAWATVPGRAACPGKRQWKPMKR